MCLKNDILASVLFLSLVPYIVLCKSNDNPIKFAGNRMLQNIKKGIEDGGNINSEEYSSPIPTQHLKSDKVSTQNITISKGMILLILELVTIKV